MVRRVHEILLPAEANAIDPHQLLASGWVDLIANFNLPAFVGEVVGRVLDEELPACDPRLHARSG